MNISNTENLKYLFENYLESTKDGTPDNNLSMQLITLIKCHNINLIHKQNKKEENLKTKDE